MNASWEIRQSLEELSCACTVSEFNSKEGIVHETSGRFKMPVPIVAVTSIVACKVQTVPKLTINCQDVDMQLDPVVETYPEPRTTKHTVHVSPGPHKRDSAPAPLFSRIMGSCKGRDPLVPLQVVEHTNKIHHKFTGSGFNAFKPFIDVTQFDWIRINNLPDDTELQVTGYNIKLSNDYTYDSFVY